MKALKKIALGFIVLFLLLVSAMAVLPYFFKDEIVQTIKDTANENVNAKVDFGDFDLSLLSSFPYFLFEIENISVVGVDTFATDTLVNLGKLELKVNMESVFNGNYTVESIGVSDLYANAIVLQDSTANWDIAQSTGTDTTEVEQTATDSVEESAPFKFELSSFSFTNINAVYDDQLGNMKAIVTNLNLNGDYKMDGEQLTLNTMTTIDGITYLMDGVKLANAVKLMAKANLDIDQENAKYTFKDNEFSLNNLALGIDGWVSMPEQGMEFDLNIDAKNNTFSEVLSLMPSVYKSDLKGIETKGDFSLHAGVKGWMIGEKLPSYEVDFSVNDGFLKYPDLPESVTNIQMEVHAKNHTGKAELTDIDLQLFHFEVAKNPIDVKLSVQNRNSDKDLKGVIKSKLNFENLGKAIPMEEGESYQGRLNADVEFAGKLSAIEQEKYEDFQLQGRATLMDFLYKSSALPNVQVKNMHLNFSPQYFELGNLELEIGKSDLAAKGRIDNILPYVFHEDTIQGTFELSSNYFDLNELMSEDTTASSAGAATTSADTIVTDTAGAGVIEVPGNIDFVLSSSFKKINYDNMPIDDFKGKLVVKNSRVKFEDAALKVLGGEIAMDGLYSTQNPEVPAVDMDLEIKNMDIPAAFNTFNTVEKMAPIAKHAKGNFSTSLVYASELTPEMEPNYNTMNGNGNLNIKDLVVEDHPLFNKISNALKNPKYKSIKANDLNIQYQFKEGKVFVKPFDLKIGSSTAKVHGWNSFEQTMEYTFEFKIPRSEFGGGANKLLSSLESQASQFGANVALGEFVLINVIASGPVSNPKIKVVPKGMAGEGQKSVKDQAVDALKKEAEELKNKAKEEAERLKKEAEDKAKAEADRLKKEAEAKAKAAVDRQKEELRKKAEAEKKKQEEAVKNKAKDLLKGWGR